MNRFLSSSEIVSEPHFFTEQTVRRHRHTLERSPEFLYRMEESQVWYPSVRQRSTRDIVALSEPPEAVRRFFTLLGTWIRGEVPITRMERRTLVCLPSVLVWLDRIDLSVYEQESRQEFPLECSSNILLCNALVESELYIMETDAYVAARLGADANVLSDDIRRDIDALWLRRYLYRVLVRTQFHDRLHLPETEWRYLMEQLWTTAHAAAGLMFGLLPEVATTLPVDGMREAGTCLPVMSGEDIRWLRDAANDPIV